MSLLAKMVLYSWLLFLGVPASAVIVHASCLEKRLENGITQRVYIFGDHVIPDASPRDRHYAEQQILLKWALKENINATILVQDQMDYDYKAINFLYGVAKKVAVTANTFLLMPYKNESVVNAFSLTCKKAQVETVNIESQYFSRIYETIPFLSLWQFVLPPLLKRPFSDFVDILNVCAVSLTMCALFADHAVDMHFKNIINNSPHAKKILQYYKKLSQQWSRRTLDVVTNALVTILSNAQQENFFVCTYKTPAYCLHNLLQQEGFVPVGCTRDEASYFSNGVEINSIDIDGFMQDMTERVVCEKTATEIG